MTSAVSVLGDIYRTLSTCQGQPLVVSGTRQRKRGTAWARRFHDAMAPYATGGVYSNYLDRDEDDRVRAAYGENYDRLEALKAEWDPENLFRSSQNVEPTD